MSRFARSRALLVLVTLGLAGGVVLPTGTAAADTTPPPPSLNGENFFKGFPFVFPADSSGDFTSGRCNAEGTTTLSGSVSGTASGPYPGTFTEDFTVQFDPPDRLADAGAYIASPVAVGPVVTFHADFTIVSGATTITGTKDVVLISTNYGYCGRFTGDVTNDGTTVYPGAQIQAISFDTRATYDAVIHTPSGSYSNKGSATASYTQEVDEIPGVATWTAVGFSEFFFAAGPVMPLGPASVALSPPDAVNNVGTQHTVTATVRDAAGGAVEGTTVLFDVEGTSTTGGSCTTDAGGQCPFTYGGPALPGADVITACADADGSGSIDAGEPCAEATKAWVLPTTTPGHVTGGGQVLNAAGTDKQAFGFNAKSDQKGVQGACTLVDPSTDITVKCLDVTTVVQSGQHATLFGRATVNDVPTDVRIDVDDHGEPGRGSDTFRIQTSSGYTAGGVLAGGNIQVH
jgi:hypothetical protein